MVDFTIPARIEYCKHIDGASRRYLNIPLEDQITWKLLPERLFWINTQGAMMNPKSGFALRAYAILIPKQSILAKEPYIDGPYLSKEHMDACSTVYHLIIKPNPTKAAAIVLKMIKAKMRAQFDKWVKQSFIDNLPFILEHTFIGHKAKGVVRGVHYHTSNVKLVRPIKSNLKSPSPYFQIEKIDPETDEVLIKKAASTFWPTNWNIEKCVIECAIAWSNMTENISDNNFHGYTSTGLKITFCFKNGALKTVFPDVSNNDLLNPPEV
jgi:hypothetical protein